MDFNKKLKDKEEKTNREQNVGSGQTGAAVAVAEKGGDITKPVDVLGALAAMSGATSKLNAGDVAIPFLDLLQKNSPQVDVDSGRAIEGAKAGMIYNASTGALYDGKVGIEVVLCGYDKRWVQWVPKDLGGGFVASYAFDPSPAIVKECVKNDKNILMTPGGDEIKETAYYFVLHEGRPAVVAMARTKLKPSRMWNTMWSELKLSLANGKKVPAPIFAQIYRLTTVLQPKKTYTFYNWVVTPVRLLGNQDVETLQLAVRMHDDFTKGRVTIGPPPNDDEVEEKTGDDGIPY